MPKNVTSFSSTLLRTRGHDDAHALSSSTSKMMLSFLAMKCPCSRQTNPHTFLFTPACDQQPRLGTYSFIFNFKLILTAKASTARSFLAMGCSYSRQTNPHTFLFTPACYQEPRLGTYSVIFNFKLMLTAFATTRARFLRWGVRIQFKRILTCSSSRLLAIRSQG